MPSHGINRENGRAISDDDHLVQSLYVLFSTHIGSRVMRRQVGSYIPGLLGRNLSPSTLIKFYMAIVLCIDAWEPRYRVTNISYPEDQNGPDKARQGKMGMRIKGNYRPYALQGDFTTKVTELDL